MRFNRLCAALACVLLLTAGCGSTGPTAAEKKAAAAKKQEQKRLAQVAAGRAKAKRDHDICARAIKPLRDSLQQVNSRLSVGLNYSDYNNRVGDVRVAYDSQLKAIEAAGADCLDAAEPLETAYNSFVKVSGIWSDCIDDYNCDFSKGDANTKAQAGWAKAGRALKKSDRKLDDLLPIP